ncbi:chymotrypsin-like [Cloeon dipterum]|uniref:chymotrypsin-like n=1 Tax=Cloeon dipterum TaxID=197152 RepID=UPI00321FF0CB
MKTVIALSLVLAVAAQAYRNGNSRPLFQAVIVIHPNLQYAVCGGSLIKQDKVLTAAHCCLGGKSFVVYLGTNNRDDSELTQKVFRSKRSTIHERYNESSKVNDLCIIHLDEEARGQDITTIRLPSRSQVAVTFERQKALVSGWELTLKDENTKKAKMMQAEVTIVQNDVCKKIFPQFTAEMLCASASSRNESYGDFAGPLTIFESDGKETQIGLASYGPIPEQGLCLPDVYVRLTEYLDWIEKWTGVEIRP